VYFARSNIYMSIYSLGFDRFDRPVEGPPISGVSITHSAERAHRVRACRRDLFFVLGRRRLGADASLYIYIGSVFYIGFTRLALQSFLVRPFKSYSFRTRCP